MKKFLGLLTLLLIISCSDDCEINSEKITSLSAEITALNLKIDEATLETAKDIYRKQIVEIEKQITAEANKCD